MKEETKEELLAQKQSIEEEICSVKQQLDNEEWEVKIDALKGKLAFLNRMLTQVEEKLYNLQ